MKRNTGTLSPTMQAMVKHIAKYGGTIVRRAGGFWSCPGSPATWGTSSVQALVVRERLEYSVWQDGRFGRFPIEAKLVQTPGHKGTDDTEVVPPRGDAR